MTERPSYQEFKEMHENRHKPMAKYFGITEEEAKRLAKKYRGLVINFNDKLIAKADDPQREMQEQEWQMIAMKEGISISSR